MTRLLQVVRALPEPVAERARIVRDGRLGGGAGPKAGTGFVLYWMRTALRGHENPALDAALLLARELALPVLVYQGLSERYPYASDRHHRFILEGARDVAGELAGRGIPYALHVERPGHRGPHLATLAARAAATVTEEMPVAPLGDWTRALAERAQTPLLAVDTACVVPMPLTPWPFARAFEFRRATAALRAERLERAWEEVEPPGDGRLPELPFEPVELDDSAAGDAALDRLIGACRIDHGVAPVADSRGGGAAGYARWQRFRRDSLGRYHRRRNDPLAGGVSRLSPYLHYGMVSPLRIAREAAAMRSEGSAEAAKGAEKFLDELLVWRELAYAYCFHEPRHATVEALPGWAERTLADHEGDPRPALPSWETLARGRTGDALWDAAQRSLLVRGELHNNLRMTWGKALLSWTRDAGEALALLEDLNHRYALDGRDPASYGGILWCLGLFDRPFEPARPILGTVRPRPTSGHARRLDVERYRRRVSRPTVEPAPSVLVVGGGISGLACARTLADAGLEVRVLDKGRGAGGRIATRRDGELSFDHGAQYFTVRDRRFGRWVDAWRRDGLVRPWPGRVGTLAAGVVGGAGDSETERLVGVPTMSAVGRHLAGDLAVETGVRVVAVERRDRRWVATLDGGETRDADRLVVTLPAPQAAQLLPAGSPLAAAAARVRMLPCWALMAAFDEPVPLALDGAFVSGSPLSWAARDSSKPGRAAGERWVLHAGPEWSLEHLELDPESAARHLLAAFAEAMAQPLPDASYRVAHRWRYARTATPLDADCLYDLEAGAGLCGDWCPGERVEGAFLSGVALAGEILRAAARTTPPGRGASSEARPGQLALGF